MRGVLKGFDHHLDQLHAHAAESRADAAQTAAEAVADHEARLAAVEPLEAPEDEHGETRAGTV